jgi:hypothetical protein
MQDKEELNRLKEFRRDIQNMQEVLFKLSDVLLDQQQYIIDREYEKTVDFFNLKF